jgi:SAM-dependent methyltransferase
MDAERPEISDLIVDYDVDTLARRPVRRAEVVERFRREGNERAARIVEGLPATGGVLDPGAVDRLLITVHAELQRISEEFEHGRRVVELLSALLAALRERGAPRPIRVADVGCGTGFVIRWLAAHTELSDVELVGVDYNAALVAEARRLAAVEGLRCRFEVANAFQLAEPAAVFLSTGVLHHFRGNALARFFAAHELEAAQAFAHFDFQPGLLANLGAWLFHAIRMREPLSRHDGVLSAVRAHAPAALLSAAREGAPRFATSLYSTRLGRTPLPRAFATVLGVRPGLRQPLERALGGRAARLGGFS